MDLNQRPGGFGGYFDWDTYFIDEKGNYAILNSVRQPFISLPENKTNCSKTEVNFQYSGDEGMQRNRIQLSCFDNQHSRNNTFIGASGGKLA